MANSANQLQHCRVQVTCAHTECTALQILNGRESTSRMLRFTGLPGNCFSKCIIVSLKIQKLTPQAYSDLQNAPPPERGKGFRTQNSCLEHSSRRLRPKSQHSSAGNTQANTVYCNINFALLFSIYKSVSNL